MTTDINGSDSQPLTPRDRRQLCRELATGETTRAALARRYGVSRPAITQFAKRHASEIAALAERLDDEFAGLWIADKAARISAYQDDHDMSLDGDYAGHYEHIRTRNQIRGAVAEELGQLPPRQTIAVQSVTHVIVGVDLEALT